MWAPDTWPLRKGGPVFLSDGMERTHMSLFKLGDAAPVMPAGFWWVAESATVVGNVRIGEGASIWFGAVVRGDNDLIDIGANTNIQDNAVLHVDNGFPLSIGAGCTVGHRATLHGCTIGENTLVGMSATILNGARIGRNCLIGAGALITEGKVFPDNTLILGVPARAVRELSPEGIEQNRLSAAHYRDNAERFATELSEV